MGMKIKRNLSCGTSAPSLRGGAPRSEYTIAMIAGGNHTIIYWHADRRDWGSVFSVIGHSLRQKSKIFATSLKEGGKGHSRATARQMSIFYS